MDVTIKTVIENNFLGKYLIPTDNIRQQCSDIIKIYVQEMNAGNDITPILVATTSAAHIGKTMLVSEILNMNEPVYVLDGHHRFIASLNPGAKAYPLKAYFTDRVIDERDIGTLYDYLDSYEYWEKEDVI